MPINECDGCKRTFTMRSLVRRSPTNAGQLPRLLCEECAAAPLVCDCDTCKEHQRLLARVSALGAIVLRMADTLALAIGRQWADLLTEDERKLLREGP